MPATIVIVIALLAAAQNPSDRIAEFRYVPAAGILANRTIGFPPSAAPDPARPTLVFVHGASPAAPVIHFTMAARLAEAVHRRHGTAFNVLAWEWNTQTLVSPLPSANLENAVDHGHRLADALQRAGVDPSRLHLIGQSSGCIVAAAAARSLANHGPPPAQLTLIEPAAFMHPLILRQLAAATAAHRVENYFVVSRSAFGAPAPGVQNFQIHLSNPTGILGYARPLQMDHLNAVRWYIDSVEHPDSRGSAGFQNSILLDPRVASHGLANP
jgi:predicted esterase